MKVSFFVKSLFGMFVIVEVTLGNLSAWQVVFITVLMLVALIIRQRFDLPVSDDPYVPSEAVQTKIVRRWRTERVYMRRVTVPYIFVVRSSSPVARVRVAYSLTFFINQALNAANAL